MRRPSLSTVHWAAIATFALLAVLQLVPALMGRFGTGYNANVLPVLGLLIGLWAAAAVGLFLKQGWAYTAGVFGAIAAAGHGAILRLGADPLGIAFLLLGPVAFALIVSDRRVMGFRAARTSVA